MRSISNAFAVAEKFVGMTDSQMIVKSTALAIAVCAARLSAAELVRESGHSYKAFSKMSTTVEVKRRYLDSMNRVRHLGESRAIVLDSLNARRLFRENPELMKMFWPAAGTLEKIRAVLSDRYPVS